MCGSQDQVLRPWSSRREPGTQDPTALSLLRLPDGRGRSQNLTSRRTAAAIRSQDRDAERFIAPRRPGPALGEGLGALQDTQPQGGSLGPSAHSLA